VSVQAACAGSGDLAVGNLVGSNIANVLLILGLAALVAPITVSIKLVQFDVPLVIGASLLLLLFGLDGAIQVWEGILLLGLLGAYNIWSIRQGRAESEMVQAGFSEDAPAVGRISRTILVNVALAVLGLVLLGLGARWLVDGAVGIARLMGVQELVIAPDPLTCATHPRFALLHPDEPAYYLISPGSKGWNSQSIDAGRLELLLESIRGKHWHR